MAGLVRSLCSRGACSFPGLGLVPALCTRLQVLGIETPTPVQQKSLGPVLEGKHVVINAETGSGKTLCYLLPMLQALYQLREQGSVSLPAPYSLVLVPTPDLAVQVSEVFHALAAPHFSCCLSYSGRRLSLTQQTQIVVAVPGSLVTYDLQRLLREVRLLCVDEVDSLLTGGEQKATWHLLDTMRQLHQRDRRREVSAARQLVMTAATLPRGGPKTAGNMLARWLPSHTQYITTDHTHQTVTSSHHTFTSITVPAGGALTELKLAQLEDDLATNCSDQDRVLVFTNTQSTTELVYQHLVSVGGSTTPPWWVGHVRRLHGGLSVEERGETVSGFRSGKTRLLVSSDLLSRGIDLPVSTVIQFDFPENSAHYLHRAGRTARAGNEGKVLSYVGERDRGLADQVQSVLNDRSRSFQEIFSRNKMLRRKMKSKQLRKEQSVG